MTNMSMRDGFSFADVFADIKRRHLENSVAMSQWLSVNGIDQVADCPYLPVAERISEEMRTWMQTAPDGALADVYAHEGDDLTVTIGTLASSPAEVGEWTGKFLEAVTDRRERDGM